MTDIEAAEKALATLHDGLHVATKRVYDIAARQQSLGFAAFVDNDPQACTELGKLNAESVTASAEVSNIKSAIAEANRRLDAAKLAAGREDASERRKRVHALLRELEDCAPGLDEVRPSDETRPAWRGAAPPDYLGNPPLQVKTAALPGALCAELSALGHDIAFPSGRGWHLAHRSDLKKALQATVHAYQRGSLTTTELRNFVGLIGGFADVVRRRLNEQANREAA
jgi:hypothetical protein